MRHDLTRSSRVGAILVGALLLSSCAGGARSDEPPPVTIHAGERSLELTAWAYCFEDVCADGVPPVSPPHVGDPEAILVEFPLGWSFVATFVPAEGPCSRAERVRLPEAGLDGRFLLRPVGPADRYDVTLFGRGDGDLVVTFRWTTPRDGPPGNLRSVSQPCRRGTS